MKVGFPNMGFVASSTATWGTQLLRVALVLDNTGSMAQSGKIGALQSAAKNLVTQLSGRAKNLAKNNVRRLHLRRSLRSRRQGRHEQ
jgi:hypothetical protein